MTLTEKKETVQDVGTMINNVIGKLDDVHKTEVYYMILGMALEAERRGQQS